MSAGSPEQERVMKRLSIVLLSLWLTGCNTMAGLGQDLQKAGEKVEEAAKKK
jgi:predicted small secreted protein